MDERYFQNKRTGEIIAVEADMAHPYLKHEDKWLWLLRCEYEIAKSAQNFAYRQVKLFCGEEGKNEQ